MYHEIQGTYPEPAETNTRNQLGAKHKDVLKLYHQRTPYTVMSSYLDVFIGWV